MRGSLSCRDSEEDIRPYQKTPPPVKLHNRGPIIYNNTDEAMEDFKKKGLMADRQEGCSASAPIERLKKISWETVDTSTSAGTHPERECVYKRLNGFQHNIQDTA